MESIAYRKLSLRASLDCSAALGGLPQAGLFACLGFFAFIILRIGTRAQRMLRKNSATEL